MARSDQEWIQDIISAVNDIRADTATMDFAAFAAQPSIIRSVLYSIAVIGEAAKNISPAFKAAYPDIPWRAIAGTRDRMSMSISGRTHAVSGTLWKTISTGWRKSCSLN